MATLAVRRDPSGTSMWYGLVAIVLVVTNGGMTTGRDGFGMAYASIRDEVEDTM